MPRIVQKYGGTSVGDVERIKKVAERIKAAREEGHETVVVLSARAGVTNELIARAKGLCPNPSERELDQLLAIGEQESIALMAMALHGISVPAVSYTGAQAGILTDKVHTMAKIKMGEPRLIEDAHSLPVPAESGGAKGRRPPYGRLQPSLAGTFALKRVRKIPVVSGFQAVGRRNPTGSLLGRAILDQRELSHRGKRVIVKSSQRNEANKARGYGPLKRHGFQFSVGAESSFRCRHAPAHSIGADVAFIIFDPTVAVIVLARQHRHAAQCQRLFEFDRQCVRVRHRVVRPSRMPECIQIGRASW